jgi:CBS-domain-containing membrane protein
VAGYGAGARLHEEGGWRWSSDAPIVISVVDAPYRIQRLLPRLQEMLSGGLMTTQEVEVLKYTHARPRGLSSKLTVQQVMETSLTTVELDTPVATVVDLLLDAPFRALPVVDSQQHLKGLISTGDLIRAGVLPMRRGLLRTARELDSSTARAVETPLEQGKQSDLTAQDVMNTQVRTVEPTMQVKEAAQIMLETGLRRLPVVESDGTLRGMVTRADLLQLIVTSPLISSQESRGTQPLRRSAPLNNLPPQQQPVGQYLNPDVATVSSEALLGDVIDALLVSPLKRVVVVDAEGRVAGIISDVDILAQMQAEARPGLLQMLSNWARGKPGHVPTGALQTHTGKARVAADIMNRDVIMVSETTTVQETIERMISTGRKVLPVVDEQKRLQGIVGRTDLLRILLEES